MQRRPKPSVSTVDESSAAVRSLVAVGLLLLLGVVVAFALVRSGGAESRASGDARPRSTPPPRRSPAMGWGSVIEASSEDQAVRGDGAAHDPGTELRAAFVPDGGVASVDAAAPPLPAERFGRLAESYARWSAEPEDAGVSSEVTTYLGRMLTDFGVHPRSAAVSCTSSICRTEVVFDSPADMAKAASIPAEGTRLRLATLIEGDAPRAVVYWDRATDELPF